MQDGFLTVSVIDSNTNRPIEGATVNIYTNPTESGESSTTVYSNLKSNISGQVTNLTLPAPDIAYSQAPSDVKPYTVDRMAGNTTNISIRKLRKSVQQPFYLRCRFRRNRRPQHGEGVLAPPFTREPGLVP